MKSKDKPRGMRRKSPRVSKSLQESPRVSKSLQESPRVSKSLQESPRVSKSLQESPRVSKSLQESPRVSKSLQESPRVSKSLQESPRVSKSLQESPRVSKSLQESPRVSKSLQESPRVSKSLQESPRVSKSLQESPRVSKSLQEFDNGTRKRDYSDWSKNDLIDEIKKQRKRKKYGLVWDEEKTKEVFEQEAQNNLPILKEINTKAIDDGSKQFTNIVIEGDNYHALSVLNYTHKGKIDIIYIDPPYNLGKEFIYNDNLVNKEDSYKHSKWLSFMKKRLVLAKKLLTDKGIIFISIDNNEQATLKLLCDEIFYFKNFIDIIVIESNPRGSQSAKHLANVHEYILVYAKSESDLQIDGFQKNESTIHKDYPEIDKDGKRYRLLGLRQRGGEWRREQRENMFYPFYVNPNDLSISLKPTKNHIKKILPKRPTGEEGRWTWAPIKAQRSIHLLRAKKVIRRGQNDFYDIFRINKFEDEEGNKSLSKPKTIWDDKEINYQNGRTELKDIFKEDVFDYPKPTYLIKKTIRMFKKKDCTVLDFFAGSGTTGHAVLQLNKEDNGNRKFILCTNNENNICTDICYPRIKKVIKGYTNPKGNKIEGLGGNLRYFKTDFIDSSSTDQNKKRIVEKSTEMMCLKEECFELFYEKKRFKIFKGHDDKYLGIVYYYDGIEPFKKQIKKLGKKINTYVFALSEGVDDDDFNGVKELIDLKPIPSAILNVYRRIFAHV